MSYTLLDLLSKVGFGFLSLNTLSQLERVGETNTKKSMSNVN
jgi:bacteriorhodopsin